MSPDVVNGVFEFAGAYAVYRSVRRIRRDKAVAGVDWSTTLFFTFWGLWNLFYYPHLAQWWSFSGGTSLVAINTWYLWLLIRYGK